MCDSLLSCSIGGYGLNRTQHVLIRNSLKKIKQHEKLSNIRFWGKIFGSQKDYLIAVSVNRFIKTFYFSNDGGIQFGLVPQMDDFIKNKYNDHHNNNNNNGMFTGDPSHILLTNGDKDEQQNDDDDNNDGNGGNDDGDDESKKKIPDPSKRKLTEMDRLSFTLNDIDRGTCIIPRGVSYITPTGDIVTNPNFKGLSSYESGDLKNYLLNRVAEENSTKIRIAKQKISNNFDYLDSLSDVHHNSDVWSIDVSESGESVRLRNLEWIGYEFHLDINTNKYVGGYFGDGQKNHDIMFML